MCISFWKRVVSWYGAQILTHVENTLWLCELITSARLKRSQRTGGWHIRSVVTQLGVTRPCVGRDPVWFSGMSIQRHSHVAMGSSLAWSFVGNPKKQYETCTVLVVEPAMECGGNLLLNIVSYSRHTIMVVCWLRFIFYFRNEFFLHYALVIISNVLLNAYQASLTIIRRNLLRFCVCIVCVCGRPYGSLIFKSIANWI